MNRNWVNTVASTLIPSPDMAEFPLTIDTFNQYFNFFRQLSHTATPFIKLSKEDASKLPIFARVTFPSGIHMADHYGEYQGRVFMIDHKTGDVVVFETTKAKVLAGLQQAAGDPL